MSTIALTTGGTVFLDDDDRVILDHPNAPEDMRHLEAGRVIDSGFQPAPFAAFALRPETLRAIAELVEFTEQAAR